MLEETNKWRLFYILGVISLLTHEKDDSRVAIGEFFLDRRLITTLHLVRLVKRHWEICGFQDILSWLKIEPEDVWLDLEEAEKTQILFYLKPQHIHSLALQTYYLRVPNMLELTIEYGLTPEEVHERIWRFPTRIHYPFSTMLASLISHIIGKFGDGTAL